MQQRDERSHHAARPRRGRSSAPRAQSGRPGARARATITGPAGALGEARREQAADQPRPPGVAVSGERAGEQRARPRRAPSRRAPPRAARAPLCARSGRAIGVRLQQQLQRHRRAPARPRPPAATSSACRKWKLPSPKLTPSALRGAERPGEQQRQERAQPAGRRQSDAEADVEEDAVHAECL